MDILIHSTYFPSISHFVAIAQADKVVFEVEDNFQKQTNRNRMYIYSPNGVQLLNIPVKHSADGNRQLFKDVRIEPAFDWQKQHFKSLEAAYRSSPFFEYFEDDIRPVFEKKHDFMMDLNFEIMDIVTSCLGMDYNPEKTVEYFREANGLQDYRYLADGKKDKSQFEPYTQVFGDKHGYINNLSILDLLFNEGRYALEYLKKQGL
ncbi:WbqC family protein [Flavobacterium sp. MFBS3-15]|uniref:WbqC family protein n=1 Tax=Flavobacterium sp. MFBS3-15 TaxID=2989816 RepID=UPI002235996F|nr:WbqC family protein [Flavobacterium sp. MFBS3-15]MCW4470513.1 WbqC family protein [Flavobacterium sp. MFBS3-15]